MDKSKLNAFRIAVADRETALVALEEAVNARQAAYETLLRVNAEYYRAEFTFDTAQDRFEAAMDTLDLTEESSAEIVRSLGGRAFDPGTGDVR